MQSNTTKPFLLIKNGDIHIHPEFGIVFRFLIEIESEIEELMGYKERLISIKKQCSELLKLMGKLTVPEDLYFEMSENPSALSEKFRYIQPVRSELIILFAHLETLRCLWTAYKLQTSDRNVLKNASDGALKEFINEFCLSKENEWIMNNPKRAAHLSGKNLVRLRNSLTHFFSVDKIGVVPLYDDKTQEIVEQMKNKVQLISSQDFSEILRSTGRMILMRWAKDCESSLSGDNNNFLEKMGCVKDVVEKNGAVFVIEKDSSKAS